MATTPAAPAVRRRLSTSGKLTFVVAAVAVMVAAFVGFRGLTATPIQSTAADGTATLHGTWEPYSCDAKLCQGYVQAGARSVFVVLPQACAEPARASEITVVGRPDPSLGSGSYRATACP